ncbi:MAG: glycosyltransferase family 87 protein [Propionibacterium sp.]|nr:glycosyltransferase family 87 protein [Propionibacterium sp.]
MHREIDVRERLPRDITWVYGVWGSLFWTYLMATGRWAYGIDSHAYWQAWRGPLYTTAPGTANAYLYSPLFAQVIWPFAQLPWPLFGILMSALNGLLLAWLLKPLGWRWAVPLWLGGLPEIVAGNISILLALAAVVGFRRPSAWAFAALTKIAPTLGPVWFLARREWRPLAITVLATAGVALPSILASPHLWVEWFDFLRSHLGESTRPTGLSVFGPMIVRAPIGIALVVWGALKNRRWYLPVAMFLCYPVLWLGPLTLLAAIPRIRLGQDQTALPQFPWERASQVLHLLRARARGPFLPGRRTRADQ